MALPSLTEALVAVALVASAASTTVLRARLNTQYDRARRVLDDAAIPTPTLARVASLGHIEWATDILWVNSTLYYGETVYARLPSRYVSRYADTMIALDPSFRPAYLWGASAMTLRTVTSTRDDVLLAGRFLERGLRRFPNDPELHLQYGFNRTFDLPPFYPHDSPERAQLRAAGAEHLRFAAASAYGPAWLPLTAARLLRQVGRERDAIDLLCDGILHTNDASVSVMLEQRLADILGPHADDPGAMAVLRFARARSRQYPWMPQTLYTFVGDRVVPPR